MSRCDTTFAAMGSEVRLILEQPAKGAPDPAQAALEAQGFIERFDAKLSRFRPDSELCAMNADPRPMVPASSLLRAAVRAGVHAAEVKKTPPGGAASAGAPSVRRTNLRAMGPHPGGSSERGIPSAAR